MLERRKTTRTPIAATGRVAFGLGPDIECTIRDVSDGGARLVFARKRVVLPGQFALEIEGEWPRLSCRVVWRAGFRAGVRFVRPGESALRPVVRPSARMAG
ncbi:PilZ domain-containing protein [Pseudorhodoplanes sp.]|uniref:PilZ domain-containing protein n=1 Tax=Pseudorhodoplanes sp. TaxID=1934341 RepID=UPI003D0DB131